MYFGNLVWHSRDQRALPEISKDHVVLALDPGHTTGWAIFRGLDLSVAGQITTEPIELAVTNIEHLIKAAAPDVIVCEDYRVYKWRAEHHIGSEMLTTRVIGCIETIAVQQHIPSIVKQPANLAKNFCTDTKLREWGFHRKGEKHACDAIRHGAYYLIFGPARKKDKTQRTVG